jgi:putative ABC transport system substrate-binding protein
MNKRRKLLVAFGAGMLAAPLVSLAQAPTGVPRIGYLALPTSTPNVRLAAFMQGLRDLDYLEGKNFVIEYRSAEGKYDRFPALALELARLNVDVILSDDGTESILAAKNATRTIPIVFTTVNDPIALGVVASLARPGGNVTGLSLQSPDTTAKRLQLLKEIVPGAKRVGFLVNPGNSSTVTWLKELPRAAKALGVELLFVEARSPAELDGAFAEIARKRVDSLVLFDDAMFIAESARIATLAARLKLPTMSGTSGLPESGGLVSYGPNRLDLVRRAATLVDKILKGAKPANLPVEQPLKFDLVINLKTAKALGITVPQSVLISADRVIE